MFYWLTVVAVGDCFYTGSIVAATHLCQSDLAGLLLANEQIPIPFYGWLVLLPGLLRLVYAGVCSGCGGVCCIVSPKQMLCKSKDIVCPYGL